MDSKDNNINDNNSNDCQSKHRWFITAGIIIYIILLGMCISQIHQSNKLTTRNVSIKAIPEKIYFSLQADSLTSNDTALITALYADIDSLNVKIDSAIRLIDKWNNQCENNLLRGFNDLRQETNNVIDKQNGWLSFWIAILALVGALLPLLIQMNMQQDQRQKFEGEKNNIRSAIDKTENAIKEQKKFEKTIQDSFETKHKVFKSEINENIDVQIKKLESFKDNLHEKYDKDTKEINKELEHLRRTRYYSEISKLSFTLIECSESILHIDDSERNKYCDDLLFKLREMTKLFFTTIAENTSLKNPDKINDLKIVLIQLLAAYNACKVLITQKHHLKNWDIVTTNIGEILQILYAENNIDNQKLTELLVQMEKLHVA